MWAYRQECLDAGSSMDGCGPLRRAESPEQWPADVRAYTAPATLPEGKVQATQFLANGSVYERTVHEPGEDIDLERYWITL